MKLDHSRYFGPITRDERRNTKRFSSCRNRDGRPAKRGTGLCCHCRKKR